MCHKKADNTKKKLGGCFMKNNKMRNKLFLLAMLGMVLAFGMMVVGCDDGKDDPEGGSKPTTLAQDATYAQAMAKLDEIIAYSGTPTATKSAAETLKTTYGTSSYETSWSSYRIAVVTNINSLIASIL
jgi:hypothetical protein